MASRIGELKLHLRIPESLQHAASDLRSTVERKVVIAVIEELERRLDAAFGGSAIIRIRRVSLRWALDAGALDDVATLTRLAAELERDLVAEIAAQSPAERLRPRSDAIVVFANEAHVEAARLADIADGNGDAWFHAGAPSAPATWDEIATRTPTTVDELMTWLERMERVERALALASDAALARIAELAPSRASDVALVQARRATARGERSPSRTDAAIAPPTAAPPSINDVARVQESALTAPPAAASPTLPATDSPAPSPLPFSIAPPPSPSPSPEPADVTATPRATLRVEPARSTTTDTPAPDSSSPTVEQTDAAPALVDGVAVETRAAGLFYLVGRVLEIDMAEAFWASGIIEGDALAHIARTIVDDADDPAWRWFGGGFDRIPAAPSLPAWALAETSDTIQHALGRRLVTLGVTRTPAELTSELDLLTADIPRRATAEPTTAAVLERCAAVLATVVAARLRQPPSWTLLREVIARPGHLVLAPDALRVVMASNLVDLDHRRAGLDQNPGHVPWLNRRVVIEFAGGETL